MAGCMRKTFKRDNDTIKKALEACDGKETRISLIEGLRENINDWTYDIDVSNSRIIIKSK